MLSRLTNDTLKVIFLEDYFSNKRVFNKSGCCRPEWAESSRFIECVNSVDCPEVRIPGRKRLLALLHASAHFFFAFSWSRCFARSGSFQKIVAHRWLVHRVGRPFTFVFERDGLVVHFHPQTKQIQNILSANLSIVRRYYYRMVLFCKSFFFTQKVWQVHFSELECSSVVHSSWCSPPGWFLGGVFFA